MPYTVGRPVQNPADFYGRQRQISRLFEIIGNPQPQSVSLSGLSRAGKTSFLRHIARPAVMVRHLRHPEKMVMVYVDMSACKTPGHFYYRVLMQLKTALGLVRTGFLWKESAPEQTTIYDVEAFLCHFPDRRIVLLLDDFDQMSPATFGRDFLTELRAMTSVRDYDLVCVTTSFTDMSVIGSRAGLPPTSPFFNIFSPTPLYLGELETAVIDTLICQPALQAGTPLSAAEMQQIKYLAGTLPFLLQVTAVRWLYHKRQGSVPDADTILTQLTAELAPYFAHWWGQFDPCQRQILEQLTIPHPKPSLTFSQFTLDEARHRLCQYGLLVERGRQTAVNGAIFHAWIAQHTTPHLEEQEVITCTMLETAVPLAVATI
jgi:serine/threonine-protein kinase